MLVESVMLCLIDRFSGIFDKYRNARSRETYGQVIQICAKDEVMKEFQSLVEKQYKKWDDIL